MNLWCKALAGLCMVPLSGIAVAADIAITFPKDGLEVQPGQAVEVVVAKNAAVIRSVTLAGDLLPGAGVGSDIKTDSNATARFTFTVPSDKVAGMYVLGAIGTPVSGRPPFSYASPIHIRVRMVASPTELIVSERHLTLPFAGAQDSITAFGTVNGEVKQPIDADLITFTSDDPNVASVNKYGRVTGVSAGATHIHLAYEGLMAAVEVAVTTAIVGDLNGDGLINIDDVNLLRSFIGAVSSGPNDARDLNHDGKVDMLDARLLVNLCSKPRCAR